MYLIHITAFEVQSFDKGLIYTVWILELFYVSMKWI